MPRLLHHVRPEHTGWLHATTLTDAAVNPDYLKSLYPTPFVTSVNVILANPDTQPQGITLRKILAQFRAANPGCTIGTYTSANVLDDPTDNIDGFCTGDPPLRLPRHAFPSDSDVCQDGGQPIHPWIVDFSDDARQNQLVEEHVAAALEIKQTLGLTSRMFDNWYASGGTNYYPFPLPTVLGYYDEITRRLNAVGIAHCANFSDYWLNNAVTELDLARIGQADGLLVENPLPKWTTAADLATGLARYRSIIKAGSVVVMVGGDDAAELRLRAGAAMLLGGTLVGWPFYLPRQEWFDWPQKYGSPYGPANQNGLIITQRFRGATFTVDFGGRTVGIK